MTPARFPHSDTPGSTLGCQLPRAYRRLLRPSSALDAKASTTCPSQLVTHTTNPTHPPTQPKKDRSQGDGRDSRCTQKRQHSINKDPAPAMTRHKETSTPPHNQRKACQQTKQNKRQRPPKEKEPC